VRRLFNYLISGTLKSQILLALIVSALMLPLILFSGCFSKDSQAFIRVAEIVPVEKEYPIKIVVYVDPASAYAMRDMLDRKSMDFQISYEIPKTGSYVRHKLDKESIKTIHVRINNEENIRIER